jgi:glycine cleavage system H protein
LDIRFTAEHEWVTAEQGVATVGITDHAQQALGDLVFVQLPAMGAELTRGGAAAVVESVKAVSDVLAPVSGRVCAVNAETVSDPSLLNSDPRGAGWLFKVQMTAPSEFDALLSEAAYQELLA